MNTSSGVGTNLSQQQRKTSNQNIQVYVRVRPLNARERGIRSLEVVDVISPREIITRHSAESKLTKKFTFDRTFGTESKQVEVYSTVVAPLIEEVLAGYNCTVFAYGQTGTGKTHTMVGNENAELKSSWEDDSDIGIIPRALSHLFDELRMMELEFSMRISYLELYNEELCDLLSSDDSTKIRIFDDSTKKGSVIIQGLEEIPVHSKDDVYKLLEKGKERRKTATTLMNAQSSRSHTVFSILVHIRENGIDGEEMLKIGKLNLVDLAGSENVSKAGNEKGIRARETVNINQSLLTLGRVITALVERTPHIPYRESKLTRLLQESLGGRTKTSIIATISPGHKDIEETLSTLEYAHRAKNIQNKPEVNQKLTKKIVLKEYTEEIDKLKRDLIAARDKNGIYLAEETYNEMTLKMDSQNRELNEKMLLLKALKDEMQNKEKIFNEVSLNLVEKTEELKRTEQSLSQTQGVLMQTKKMLNNTKRRYKEKKVILQSHIKTEKTLTSQATQILEVADAATNDTNQLHNTIERRKDVDEKIQTACERFAARMHDNFELMEENLNNFQKQHNSHSQMIIEELDTSINVQNKLMNNANEKMENVDNICKKFLTTTNEISEKFTQHLLGLSEEQKNSLENLFRELRESELKLKAEIVEQHLDLKRCNEEQKTATDNMRKTIVGGLKDSTNEMHLYACQIQKHMANVRKMSEANMLELKDLRSELEQERDIAEEERVAMEECIKTLQSIKEKSFESRLARINKINHLADNLDTNDNSIIAELGKEADYSRKITNERSAKNNMDQERIECETKSILQNIEENIKKTLKAKSDLETLCEESSKRIDTIVLAKNSHCSNVKQLVNEYEVSAKRLRIEHEEKMTAAKSLCSEKINENMQQLKKHITIAHGFTNNLQQHVLDYKIFHQEHMSNSINDVDNFKQSELKTYVPTGTTPSKRNFIYPRNLASTSPHSEIVKRFRQENDWSDLDTTATIDEGSEDEGQGVMTQDISNVEAVLNSTPINAQNSLTTGHENDITSRSLNTLKAIQFSRNTSLPNNSPQKLTPQRNASLKENKENVSERI